jgi:peroxiredoxin
LQSLEAPDFTLPDLDGKTYSLSQFRGKKVLLLSWASW